MSSHRNNFLHKVVCKVGCIVYIYLLKGLPTDTAPYEITMNNMSMCMRVYFMYFFY